MTTSYFILFFFQLRHLYSWLSVSTQVASYNNKALPLHRLLFFRLHEIYNLVLKLVECLKKSVFFKWYHSVISYIIQECPISFRNVLEIFQSFYDDLMITKFINKGSAFAGVWLSNKKFTFDLYLISHKQIDLDP